MSLNHILKNSPANSNEDVKFKNIECENFSISRMTLNNVSVISSAASQPLATCSMSVQKMANQVTIYISSLFTVNLNADGYVIINYNFDQEYWPENGSQPTMTLQKKKTGENNVTPSAYVIFNNSAKRIEILNGDNSIYGLFSNGDDVLINGFCFTWFTDLPPQP